MATKKETVQVINPELAKLGLTEEKAQKYLKNFETNPDFALFTYEPGPGLARGTIGNTLLASDNSSWDDKIAVATWSMDPGTHRLKAEDLYVTEVREVEIPDPVQPAPTPVVAKTTKTKTPKVGGNTSTQTQSATTTTTQEGKQSQGNEQAQRNEANQSMQGQGNVALVVTPNAESSQQLESQAFGSASQTQQVEVASQADAASAMTNDQHAIGATYNVAPVINVDASDRYTTSSDSQAQYTPVFTPSISGSTAVLLVAAALGVLYLWPRKQRKGKP